MCCWDLVLAEIAGLRECPKKEWTTVSYSPCQVFHLLNYCHSRPGYSEQEWATCLMETEPEKKKKVRPWIVTKCKIQWHFLLKIIWQLRKRNPLKSAIISTSINQDYIYDSDTKSDLTHQKWWNSDSYNLTNQGTIAFLNQIWIVHQD